MSGPPRGCQRTARNRHPNDPPRLDRGLLISPRPLREHLLVLSPLLHTYSLQLDSMYTTDSCPLLRLEKRLRTFFYLAQYRIPLRKRIEPCLWVTIGLEGQRPFRSRCTFGEDRH